MLDHICEPRSRLLANRSKASSSMIHTSFASFCQRSLSPSSVRVEALRRSAATFDLIRQFRHPAFRTMAQAATLETQTQGIEASRILRGSLLSLHFCQNSHSALKKAVSETISLQTLKWTHSFVDKLPGDRQTTNSLRQVSVKCSQSAT